MRKFGGREDETVEKLVLIDGNSIVNRAFYGVPELTNKEGLHKYHSLRSRFSVSAAFHAAVQTGNGEKSERIQERVPLQ